MTLLHHYKQRRQLHFKDLNWAGFHCGVIFPWQWMYEDLIKTLPEGNLYTARSAHLQHGILWTCQYGILWTCHQGHSMVYYECVTKVTAWRTVNMSPRSGYGVLWTGHQGHSTAFCERVNITFLFFMALVSWCLKMTYTTVIVNFDKPL